MFTVTTQKAYEIVQQFASEVPPALLETKNRKLGDKLERAQLKFSERIATYQSEERMWVIRRIVFANALQRELQKLGYQPQILRPLMEHGLIAMAYQK